MPKNVLPSLPAWIELCENRAAALRCLKFKTPGLYDPDALDDRAEAWEELAAFLRRCAGGVG